VSREFAPEPDENRRGSRGSSAHLCAAMVAVECRVRVIVGMQHRVERSGKGLPCTRRARTSDEGANYLAAVDTDRDGTKRLDELQTARIRTTQRMYRYRRRVESQLEDAT
jgi:hypothetical protein